MKDVGPIFSFNILLPEEAALIYTKAVIVFNNPYHYWDLQTLNKSMISAHRMKSPTFFIAWLMTFILPPQKHEHFHDV